MSQFRVLTADDHPIILSGLRLLLANSTPYVIVAEARDAEAARAAARDHQPDIIISDLAFGGRDGLNLIAELSILAPHAAILAYSSSDEALWSPKVMAAGARAYVSKSKPLEAVLYALDAIVAGEPDVQAARALPYDAIQENILTLLSPRELQILTLMGKGRSPQQLGQELGLSVKTVGTYRERLKTKLGLDSVRMLERYATHLISSAHGRL